MIKQKIIKSKKISNESLNGWITDHCILIEGSSISNIIHESKLPSDYKKNYEVIDLGNSFLLPGLIETHAHFQFSATPDAYKIYFDESDFQKMERAKENAKTALYSGVTTIRDLGAPNELIFPLKSLIDSEKIDGPEIFPTGTPLTIENGHCWFFGSIANTVTEIYSIIERQLELGATHIKIMASGGYFTPSSNPRISQYSFDTLKKVVDFCNNQDTYLCAHTLSNESTKSCIDAGVHNIIHGRWFDKSLDKSYKFEEEYSNKMSEKGIFVDSTIAKHLLEYESKLKGEKQRKPNPNVINSEPTFEEIINIFRKLDDDNVNIIGALDMGMSQAFFDKCVASAWAHVEWLGFDHWKAIRSITSLNAKALKIDNYKGYLKQGYIADMVSFDNDPTLNIRNLEIIPNSIIKAGKAIKVNGQLIT